uniref:Peptidase S1 domain-containing protein n=1 Tax=Anopheles coluzzii TaxID=1518534 RepID=A0A8W7P2A5_ANOCL
MQVRHCKPDCSSMRTSEFFLRGINLRNNLLNELPYLPELFTNVDRFLEWIVDNMKGKEPNAQSKTDLTKATDRRINLPPIQNASKRKMFNFSNCGIMPSANESSNSYPTIPWLGFLYSNATNKTPKKCVVTLISEWYAVSLAACFSDNSKE